MIPKKQKFEADGTPVDVNYSAAGGPAFIVDEIILVWNAMPVTSEELDVLIISGTTVKALAIWDPANDFSTTTQGIRFECGLQVAAGDMININYANTDARVVQCEILTRDYGG